jgi:hypothetical protein
MRRRPIVRAFARALALAGGSALASAVQAGALTPGADEMWSSNRLVVPDLSDLQARFAALSLRLRPPLAVALDEMPVPGEPVAPQVLEPVAGAKAMVDEVHLRWQAPAAAESFLVEVARDAGFGRITWRGAGVRATQATFEPTASAFGAPEGAYFWRVAGVRHNGARGPWSGTASFELRAMPRAPMATLSPDGRRIELGWDEPPEHRVQAQLARDPGFREIEAQASFAGDRGALACPAAGNWYARYRTIDADGFTTPWSPASRVEVAPDWRKSVQTLVEKTLAH